MWTATACPEEGAEMSHSSVGDSNPGHSSRTVTKTKTDRQQPRHGEEAHSLLKKFLYAMTSFISERYWQWGRENDSGPEISGWPGFIFAY